MFKSIKRNFTEVYWILFYNHFATNTYIADTIFEPFLWIISKVAKKAGPIFVTLVIILTTSVVVIYYSFILPWNRERWPPYLTLANYIFGHWLLLNIVFHYYMGVTTSPGRPPSKVESPVSICKNCIIPKPPRTHHCSVCKQCVLKMDHHCPWLNNCVGHYNHRYFFLFGVYMCSGTIFVSLSIYNQFSMFFGGGFINFLASAFMPVYALIVGPTYAGKDRDDTSATPTVVFSDEYMYQRFWVTYELFLCTSVTVALGALVIWHAMLISKGETSIEKHVNTRERRRMQELGAASYTNPFDFGFRENWRVFFGIEAGTGRSWRHVLLPSTHHPTGDGKTWRTANSKTD